MITPEHICDFFDVLRSCTLTTTKLEILALLYTGRCTQIEVAQTLRMSPPLCKYHITELEKLCLIKRYVNPRDARGMVLAIEPEGVKVIERITYELAKRTAKRAESAEYVPNVQR